MNAAPRRGRRPVVATAVGIALVVLAGAASVVGPSQAASDNPGRFSASCRLSHVANDDPIVFPGQPRAAHVHQFAGAWSTDAFSTAESLAASGTTCDPVEDTSAYWAPALYLRGMPVEVHHLTGYYGWGRRTTDAQRRALRPWPPGFRMIAQLKDSTPERVGDPIAGWWCSDASVRWGYASSLSGVAYHCPEGGLQVRLLFPDCWDGVNLDTVDSVGAATSNPLTGATYPNDHRSHTAYADASGDCPASHPVATPRLDFRINYEDQAA